MKLTPVEKIPGRKAPNRWGTVLDEFMAMDAKIVEIDVVAEGYKSAKSAYSAIWYAIKKSQYGIKFYIRDNKIYLQKLI